MKYFIFLFLFIFSFSALQSQVQVGIKGGYNLSTFDVSIPSDFYSYSSKSNFNVGIVVPFRLGGRFFLQPESVYSGQGAKVELSGINGEYDFQNLNFPVLLKYIAPFHFYAETGPQLGFLLGAKLYEDGLPSVNVKSQTNSSGYSWVFGVGYQLPMNFGLDFRYNLGLTHVQTDNSNAYNDASIKNNVIQIGMFYLFGSP